MRRKEKSRLSSSTLKELMKQNRTVLMLTVMLAIVLLILFGLVINLYFKNRFSPITIVPITLTPILVVLSTILKEINTELQSRK